MAIGPPGLNSRPAEISMILDLHLLELFFDLLDVYYRGP